MQKTITHITHPRRSHMVGDGFKVAQYIPGYGREMSPLTSPWLMLDYNAPWEIPPQTDGHRPGVGWHPHRGFETITIVYSGEIEHRDTAGGGGTIGADEVQWMTAGSGLLHQEFMTAGFSATGGTQHAVQLWLDLPRGAKMTPPRYQSLTRDSIPELRSGGVRARIIAGTLRMIGESGEVLTESGIAETHSPVELYDMRLGRETHTTLEISEGYNTLVLVTSGSARVSERDLESGDMAYLSRTGVDITIDGMSDDTMLLIMAGKPLDQDVVQSGPFVMTTMGEIEEAWSDYEHGMMGVPPHV